MAQSNIHFTVIITSNDMSYDGGTLLRQDGICKQSHIPEFMIVYASMYANTCGLAS